MRKHILVLLLVCSLIVGIGILGEAKTLVVGMHDDLAALDPADFSHRETESMLRQVYEGLSTYMPSREIHYELAESIEPIDDTTYEIRIREGVKFHDGTPLTAEDVAFSINRLIKPGAMAGRTSQRRGLMGPTKEAVVVDEHTVHVKLENPWPLFPRFIPWQMIVPSTVGDGYITEPVGTGPYMFEEWVRDSHFSVSANPNHWRGKPSIDKVVFRVIGDESARVSALRAGEIDIATMIPVHEIPALEADPNIEVLSVLGTRSYFLEMNVNKPPFNDVRVRQAMNYAVDIDTLIEVLYEGRATRIPFILSPQAFAYHDGLPFYEYNPEKAMQLLAEAGYPNGFEFELDVVDTHRARAEIYQAMLAVVGINAKIRTWPTVSAMRDAWMQAKHKPAEEQRDALLTDWGNASLDPFDIFIPKCHSDASGLGRSNYSGYSNPEVDRLLESTLTSSFDEERRAAFLKAQEIVHGDVPMVFEFVAHEIYGIRNRVKNFQPSPDGRLHLWAGYLE